MVSVNLRPYNVTKMPDLQMAWRSQSYPGTDSSQSIERLSDWEEQSIYRQGKMEKDRGKVPLDWGKTICAHLQAIQGCFHEKATS